MVQLMSAMHKYCPFLPMLRSYKDSGTRFSPLSPSCILMGGEDDVPQHARLCDMRILSAQSEMMGQQCCLEVLRS